MTVKEIRVVHFAPADIVVSLHAYGGIVATVVSTVSHQRAKDLFLWEKDVFQWENLNMKEISAWPIQWCIFLLSYFDPELPAV